MTNEHIEKLKGVVKGTLAVFIDAANLEMSVKDMYVNPKDIPDYLGKYKPEELLWRVSYKKMRELFSSFAPLDNASFYTARFNSESHDKFLTILKRAGYRLVTKLLKEYSDHTLKEPHRKANFDVEISVDAVDQRGHFDTLILFSGDSDFDYLIRYLRGHGKRVIVFSRTGHVSAELIKAASQYFDIVDFRDSFLEIIPRKAKSLASKDARPRS